MSARTHAMKTAVISDQADDQEFWDVVFFEHFRYSHDYVQAAHQANASLAARKLAGTNK